MSRRTHCSQGHEFTPENTYIHTYKKTGRTKRWCKRCRCVNSMNSYERTVGDWSAERVLRKHEKERDRRLRRNYGISTDQYDLMFQEQAGLCAICRSPETTKKKTLSVDHDHETGTTRKLLCHHCNSLLGHAKDNVGILQSAIQYLKGYPHVADNYNRSIFN